MTEYRVLIEGLNVRIGPSFEYSKTGQTLHLDQVIIALSITKDYDGRTWIKHELGWSSAQSPTATYMQKISGGPVATMPPDKDPPIDVGGNKGPKGDKGDKGDRGVDGTPGAKGDKGDKGDPGIQGIQGLKGDKGDPGAAGSDGAQGVRGDPGAKGDKGDKGDPGELLDGSITESKLSPMVVSKFQNVHINVRDFGAVGDGQTLDTPAFKACAAAVNAIGPNVPIKLLIPPGDYMLELDVSEILFDFSNRNGIIINGEGANLIRNNNPFAQRQSASIFKFTGCKNITVTGVTFKTAENFITPDLVANPSGTDYGWTGLYFFDNNFNIRVEQVHMENNFRCILFGDQVNRRNNKNIYIDASAFRSEYGVNCANSGDDAVIKFRGELIHRSYFIYGVNNHKVDLVVYNPRTSSAYISAYDYDTRNIDLRATLHFTDHPEHWNKSNGAIDINTQVVKDAWQTKSANVINVKVDVVLIDTGTILTGYRPVVGIYSFKETGSTINPGYLDNLTISADIRKWRGHTIGRSPLGIGQLASTPYDANGVCQMASSEYLEPEIGNMTLENIVIHSDKLHVNQLHSMEYSFSKLKGTFILRNFDGNMSPSVRNLGTTGKIIFENINVNDRFGQSWQLPSLNRDWIKNSNNHVIYDLKESVPSKIPAGNKVKYVNIDTGMVNVKDWGAQGNGIDDDTAALQACANYVRYNIDKVKGIIFPPGIYMVNIPIYDSLFIIVGANGLRIEADGATIRRNAANAAGEYAIVFQFDNSNGVIAYGPKLDTASTYVISDLNVVDSTYRGYTLFEFKDNNRNITLLAQDVKDNYRIVNFQGRNLTTFNENISIQGKVARCEYGVNFQSSGDHAKIQLYGELVHRPYYVQGVTDHDIQIHSKSPRTVTAMIGAESKDTVGIRGSITIEFTNDPVQAAKSNGGVEFFPVARTNGTARGHLRNIDLKVTAIDRGMSAGNYRPVVAFGCSKYNDAPFEPGSIKNVKIDAEIIGWKGNLQTRPAIGFIELTGYNSDGTGTFNSDSAHVFYEPELENITINARVHTPNTGRTSGIELSMTKLTGTFRLNYEGNMTPNVRNLGSTGRVIFENIHVHTGAGFIGAGQAYLDHEWIKNSNNHWVMNHLSEQEGASPKPSISKVMYPNWRLLCATTTAANELVVDIPLRLLKPDGNNYRYYTLRGHTASFNFEAVLEARYAGTAFSSSSRIIRWNIYKHNDFTAQVSVTPSIVAVNGGVDGLTLKLTAVNPVVGTDMNSSRLVITDYERLF